MGLLDWVKVTLAVGVTIYALLSYHRLKGGMMSEPYLVFVACGLVGACSAASDAIGLEVAQELLGIVFYCLLFVGFWSLCQTWRRFGS